MEILATSTTACLPREFYESSAESVASQLLGHFLLRNTSQGLCGGIIIEAEAYLQNDPASHSFRGQSARNKSMFGPPGHAYVYFIYGKHFCFNAVCGPEGVGEAVLVRAILPQVGLPLMARLRSGTKSHDVASGPAKLCQAMSIDRALDGADLCASGSGVWIGSNAERERWLKQMGPIVVTPRIGISKACDLKLRFLLQEKGTDTPVESRERI